MNIKKKLVIELDYETYLIAEQERIKQEQENGKSCNKTEFYSQIIKKHFTKK